ncbi:MAG: hypothetical protein A4S09_01680 [Proteobacteria bacterium SG_bin7]|nr:MAG: hypothetical protein A4S09_01680 [Proteobacteria bacterium SG_bin7]
MSSRLALILIFFFSFFVVPLVAQEISDIDQTEALNQLRIIAPLDSSNENLTIVSVPEEVATSPTHSRGTHYYLLKSVESNTSLVKSTTELMKINRFPIERLFWYSSIPVLTASKLFPYFLAGANPWVVLPVAAFILVKAPIITVAKSMVGLQIRARFRARRQAEVMRKQIPNIEKIFFMQAFEVQTGHVVTDNVKASTLFLVQTRDSIDAKNSSIRIPYVDDEGGKLKAQDYQMVEKEDFSDASFEFRLGSKTFDTSGIPSFEVSFDELVGGVRLPDTLREQWYAPMRSDWRQDFRKLFDKGRSLLGLLGKEQIAVEHDFFVELKLKNRNEEVILGNYTTGHGVKAFLGETFFRKLWSRLRYFFNFSESPFESAKLKIQESPGQIIRTCRDLF